MVCTLDTKLGQLLNIDFILFFSTAGTPEENLEAAAAADPILLLDQEQINRLENVLRSEEAKDILGDVLSNAGNCRGTNLCIQN